MRKFLAGVGDAILLKGQTIIGFAKTLTESTFGFTISSEEIRGGKGNALIGKYYHDSGLTVQITDSCFKLEYIAANLGVDLQKGGLGVYQGELTVQTAGKVTLPQAPTAVAGSLIGWYRTPSEKDYTVGTITEAAGTYTMAIPNATVGEKYCVMYFYQNANADNIIIPVDYVPDELHVIILNDLFNADISTTNNATKIGRLITDIPRLQLDGAQDLNLTATSAATVSLSGSALAVDNTDSCEGESYYCTMTEEIFGAKWQNEVKAIAFEDADISLAQQGTQTLVCYVLFDGNKAPKIVDNANFTFAVEDGDTFASVDTKGVVTAKAAGTAHISATLKGADPSNGPAVVGYAEVTVTG